MLGSSNLKVLSDLRRAHLTKKAIVFCLLWWQYTHFKEVF